MPHLRGAHIGGACGEVSGPRRCGVRDLRWASMPHPTCRPLRHCLCLPLFAMWAWGVWLEVSCLECIPHTALAVRGKTPGAHVRSSSTLPPFLIHPPRLPMPLQSSPSTTLHILQSFLCIPLPSPSATQSVAPQSCVRHRRSMAAVAWQEERGQTHEMMARKYFRTRETCDVEQKRE